VAIRANDQQVLDDLYAQYKSAYGGAKQDYFALAYLRKRFKIEIDDLKYRVAFNGNDYGIDAYFIDGEAHNLYLYQFKWTENYALFKDSMVRLTNYGIDRVFGNPTQDTTQNELIVYLKKELNEDRDKISRVYIHFVFKGDVDACEKSEGLANRREDLESKAHVINTYFGREIEVHVDFISDKPGKKPTPPAQSYEITLSEHIKTALPCMSHLYLCTSYTGYTLL
jgi:hypothetical protein